MMLGLLVWFFFFLGVGWCGVAKWMGGLAVARVGEKGKGREGGQDGQAVH